MLTGNTITDCKSTAFEKFGTMELLIGVDYFDEFFTAPHSNSAYHLCELLMEDTQRQFSNQISTCQAAHYGKYS